MRKELEDAIMATRKKGKGKSCKSSSPTMQTDHDVKPKEGVVKATKKLLLVSVLYFLCSNGLLIDPFTLMLEHTGCSCRCFQ